MVEQARKLYCVVDANGAFLGIVDRADVLRAAGGRHAPCVAPVERRGRVTTPGEAAEGPSIAAPPTASGPWFTPDVRGIGLASLLADAGHEIPTALLPSFLTSTLGALAAALGLIEGIADALSGITKVIGGALADDPQRRRSIAVGDYTPTAILSAAIGLATVAWQVALLRAGSWTARGIRVPSRNALLMDAVDASPTASSAPWTTSAHSSAPSSPWGSWPSSALRS
jgi:hypothetical protein